MMRLIVAILFIISILYNSNYIILFHIKDIYEDAYMAEIVNTPEKRQKGLSKRIYMLPETVMLFAFDKEYKYGFWMKDMNFPIDIYWIDSYKKTMSYIRDIKPESYPNVFYPQGDVLYVLETRKDEIDMSLNEIPVFKFDL